MGNLHHNIRQIFRGTRTVDNQSKYNMLCICIAFIHILFALSFGERGVMTMFWYNVAMVVFYGIHILISIPQEHYMFVFYSSVTAVLIYSTISSVALGWQWGFSMYLTAMVPATFYLTYTLPNQKSNLSIPVFTSMVVCSCYILVRAVCGRTTPIYQDLDVGNLQICLYYFNIIISFIMLVLFSFLFALELNYVQKQLELENRVLGEAANYDTLTRLLNRRSMNERLKEVLEKAEEKGQPFCIMLVDIDDFKKVNDTYGHDCGDEVLIAIANAIATDVREEDSVCRWGGEEILILIKAELHIARKVAERIRRDVMNTVVKYKDEKVQVTLTIGVADYKKNQSIRAMIEESDRNLYYGKAHGKNQVVTSHERFEE